MNTYYNSECDATQTYHHLNNIKLINGAAITYWRNRVINLPDTNNRSTAGCRHNINNTEICIKCWKTKPAETIKLTEVFEGGVAADICSECYDNMFARLLNAF
jgi:hypothetical protein